MKHLTRKNTQTLLLLSILLICLQCSKSKKPADPPPPPPPPTPPALTAVSPGQGFIGDVVSLEGSHLANADKITFNGTASKIVENSDTKITSVVPQGIAPGQIKIAVHAAGGTSNELSFEVFPTPIHIDSLPPVVSKTVPDKNFTDYPLLIYGDNLSGVVKITFGDKEAVVFANNKNVVTTVVPKGLTAGTATIKIMTAKGTVSVNFQVKGAPPSGAAPVNFSIVSIPPPPYVPTIANDWSCGLFSTVGTGDSLFGVRIGGIINVDDPYTIGGKYYFHYDPTKNYTEANYIEFTDTLTGETFAGMFSAKIPHPCQLEMVLISSKSGTISSCTFNREDLDADCN